MEIQEVLKSLSEENTYLKNLQEQRNHTEALSVSESMITKVDSVDLTNQLNKIQRAQLFFYKGRALAVQDTYDKAAEDYLTKSVKLDPTNFEAWNWLGEIFYLKKDYAQSKRCFEGSMQYSGETPEALRKLSMVMRFLGEQEERKQNVRESVEIAKKAVSLSMRDGQSWYILGNAHLTNFFVNNPSSEELNRALKSYTQAEKFLPYDDPDLHFNRATALKYFENYQEAVWEFQKAHALDSTLQADSEVSKISERVQLVSACIAAKCNIKKKTLSNIVRSIPELIKHNHFGSSYELKSVSELNQRSNKEVILACKVLGTVTKNIVETPAIFIACDSQGFFFALSIYNANSSIHQQIQFNSGVFVKNPLTGRVSLTTGTSNLEYISVRIADPSHIMVDNKDITQAFSPSEVVNKAY